jgi:hypothetical protein
MAFQAVPNTIQCDVVFLLFGQRIENVYHVEVPGGVDAPTIVDTASEVGNWVMDTLMPSLSHNLTFLLVEATNLSIEGGGTATFAPTTPVPGGSGDSSMPGGTAFCVSLRTAESGRSHRGRKYISGLAVSQISGNQVLTAYGNALVAAIAELISVLSAVGKLLVVVSRVLDGVERVVGITTAVTAAVAVDYNIDSQRRRLTGRGT